MVSLHRQTWCTLTLTKETRCCNGGHNRYITPERGGVAWKSATFTVDAMLASVVHQVGCLRGEVIEHPVKIGSRIVNLEKHSQGRSSAGGDEIL